ncbi:MAG: DUF1611 domain-containing protein [Thermoanaerobaculia bacterium]
MKHPEGNAIVYCEGAFGTTYGKTAHGLVRRSARYRILAVVDSGLAGRDAGECLDHNRNGIRITEDLSEALLKARLQGAPATHFIIGLAPDGGRLPLSGRRSVLDAIHAGLNIDSGLHEFLSEDPEISAAAAERGVTIRDVRKPPPIKNMHFFSGKIEEVACLKVAVLGTDSAVGKRTTAWMLRDGLEIRGRSTELVGTGQTAWMQGARFGVILDSLVNDFVTGEIEHAVWSAWNEEHPEVILLEGQGSLMNPAYPGGFELLAAGRPDVVVLQHAPARAEYDGFPGYTIHPLETQIEAIELISGKPVVAITLNDEHLAAHAASSAKKSIQQRTGLPACYPLREGCGAVIDALRPFLNSKERGSCPPQKSAASRTERLGKKIPFRFSRSSTS